MVQTWESKHSHFLIMETRILIVILLIIISFSSEVQTITPSIMPAKLHHQGVKNQRAIKEPEANQQRTILEFLSAFDEAQKNTNPRFMPETTSLQAYAKIFGKTIKGELEEGHFSPPFSQQDGVAKSNKDLLKINPSFGKNFRKAAPQSSKKSKKRACFWKYCVQSK